MASPVRGLLCILRLSVAKQLFSIAVHSNAWHQSQASSVMALQEMLSSFSLLLSFSAVNKASRRVAYFLQLMMWLPVISSSFTLQFAVTSLIKEDIIISEIYHRYM